MISEDMMISDRDRSGLDVDIKSLGSVREMRCWFQKIDGGGARHGGRSVKCGVRTERTGASAQAARNKIDRKHVDFVVCDSTMMTPLLGIELDDSSHQRQKAIESDTFKNEVFQRAGLPLLGVRAQRGYVMEELRQVVEATIRGNVQPPPVPQDDDAAAG